MDRQCVFYKTHEILRKVRKHKNECKNILDGWKKMTNTANLCQILKGLRRISFNTMKSHGKSILTLQQEKKSERELMEKFIKYRGNTRTWNQRSDFEETKKTCKRLCQEQTEIFESGNKWIPSEQQVRQKFVHQLKGAEEKDYCPDASTGRRYHLSSTTYSSSFSSSWWPRGTGIRGNLHIGVNNDFFHRRRLSVFRFPVI